MTFDACGIHTSGQDKFVNEIQAFWTEREKNQNNSSTSQKIDFKTK